MILLLQARIANILRTLLGLIMFRVEEWEEAGASDRRESSSSRSERLKVIECERGRARSLTRWPTGDVPLSSKEVLNPFAMRVD